MNGILKATAAIMLMMVFAVGCTKPEAPNSGGNNNGQNDSIVDPNNGGNNGGGNGGGTSQYYQVSVSTSAGGSVTGGGSYLEGTTCTVTAIPETNYTFVDWTENSSFVSSLQSYSFAVTGDRSLEANFTYSGGGINVPTGAINGLFTINASGDQVYFSKGNLQYKASTDTWRFAENQWDFCGGISEVLDENGNWITEFFGNVTDGSNDNPSSSCNNWIDLFGWGTSNYNHGAICYQPWSVSENTSDFYAYGSYDNNLYDQTGQADWGYNPIINGGNQENQWRTLTRDEWAYILEGRHTVSDIRFAKAVVNGVNGLIILPDDWSGSSYSLNYPNTTNMDADYITNNISLSVWENLFESHGAVFLPSDGYRSGTSNYNVGSSGLYWTSSCHTYTLFPWDEYGAWIVEFWDYGISPTNTQNRFNSCSVRLVQFAE